MSAHAYEAVIGLEVHAQLLTQSKLFCRCSTQFGAPPNTNICPVCTGQPGALPVLNKEAVRFAIRAGLATHCTIDLASVFARKNYFYPDLPKGYQISQYDKPLCKEGYLDISVDGQSKRVQIIRIHMEEDAGKSLHEFSGDNATHVDLNRSSVPLIEIVSGPDMRSAEEASAYLKTLRNILIYLGVCDGNMQEGSFRCDANVSIRPAGTIPFGTRTELKNMNSFNAVERAIRYELKRQQEVIESGDKVIQETLLWNDAAQRTETMRSKEEAHDYRYFPDPDLLMLEVNATTIDDIRATLPELPDAKAARFVSDYQIPAYDAAILTQDKALADYYEACIHHHREPKKISNWIMTELLREMNAAALSISEIKITAPHLAALVKLIDDGVINGKVAKELFIHMWNDGSDPAKLVKDGGLEQVTDTSAIEPVIDAILAANADNVARYKSGKSNVMGFFVGLVMKETKGKANPKMVNDLLKKKLDSE